MAVGVALALICTPVMGQVSREQLYEMIENQVDVDLIVKVIERDCVDFEVTGANLTELSKVVPKAILMAAIDCRDGPRSTRDQDPEGKISFCSHLGMVFENRGAVVSEEGALSEHFAAVRGGLDVSWGSNFRRYRTTKPFPGAVETGIRIKEEQGDLYYYIFASGKDDVQAMYLRLVGRVRECLQKVRIWNDVTDQFYSGENWIERDVEGRRWSGKDFSPPPQPGFDPQGGIMVRKTKRGSSLEVDVYSGP